MSTPYVTTPPADSTPPSNGPGYAESVTGTSYQPQGTIYGQVAAPVTGNPETIYGPSFAEVATGNSYSATSATPVFVPTNSGNPTPAVYNPGYFTNALANPYSPSAQTTDSQVTSPVIVFQVNLETVNRQGQLVPQRTYLAGNETVAEADYVKQTRSLFIPNMVPDGEDPVHTSGSANIGGIGGIINNANRPTGYLQHGDQFTVNGMAALNLLNQYVSTPPSPSDLLIVVSRA